MTDQTAAGIDWRPTHGHWGVVSKILHWTMALMIVTMLGLGFYMTSLEGLSEEKINLYQLHKSLGFTIGALAIVRLAWRAPGPVPILPTSMAVWQKACAHLLHVGIYGLMIAMPITGWIMSSASPLQVPTKYFGLFEIPHITGPNEALEDLMHETHEILAFTFIGLLTVHVLAAMKHHFVDDDTIFVRMLPGRTRQHTDF